MMSGIMKDMRRRRIEVEMEERKDKAPFTSAVASVNPPPPKQSLSHLELEEHGVMEME